jgi:hypothetical protein
MNRLKPILYLACEFKISPARKAAPLAMSMIMTNQVPGCGFFISKMARAFQGFLVFNKNGHRRKPGINAG